MGYGAVGAGVVSGHMRVRAVLKILQKTDMRMHEPTRMNMYIQSVDM